MKIYGFEIGDKVKMVDGLHFSMGKRIGTVVGFDVVCRLNRDTNIYYILVDYEGSGNDNCGNDNCGNDNCGGFPFREGEIIHTIVKGQQLLFSFMEDK